MNNPTTPRIAAGVLTTRRWNQMTHDITMRWVGLVPLALLFLTMLIVW